MSDESSNRVLEYTAPFSTGESASLVLGQSSFTTGSSGTTATGLSDPRGLVFDSSGNLWVADANNNRVIEYTTPFATGEAASLVLGQSSFVSGSSATTSTGEYAPTGLAFDATGNLWVSDTGNQRTLEYSTPFTTGEAASLVLGQSSFTTRTSATSPAGELVPSGLAFDSKGNLWLADALNNRVIEYTTPFTTGEAASLVLGQSSLYSSASGTSATAETKPGDVAFDSSGNLWVVDTTDSRVLEYVNAPFSTGQSASLVLGQSSFTTSVTATTATGEYYPEGLAFDSSGNLWVADNYNNRVIEYAGSTTTSTTSSTTTTTSTSVTTTTSTTLSTTTLASCAGNSAGNGIFGVCVNPAGINTGGTVTVTGDAFVSGSTYVLNVTQPDGARYGTEAYSYGCATAPCTTSAVFPTDFLFQISGATQAASTSSTGTYTVSVCAYFAPRHCATTTFVVSSSTTTTTTSTASSSSSTTSTTSTSTSTTTTTSSSTTTSTTTTSTTPVPTCPPCTIGHILGDSVAVGDKPSQGNANLPDTASVSDAPGFFPTIVKTLKETVSFADSIPNQVLNSLTDGIGFIDNLFQSPNVKLSYVTFQAHSPVNILVTAPDGLKAGFFENGTAVNQLGANLTGPNTEPETVTLPYPAQGQYSVQVFGKPAALTSGSPFTITGESVGASGSVVSSWSYSGEATPATDVMVPVSVLSNGDVSSFSPTLPVPFVPLVLAIVGLGALGVLFFPGSSSVQSRRRRFGQGA